MIKTLFCISASDSFAHGCAVMVFSLRKHLKDFEQHTLKVYYTNLSEESKKIIRHAAGSIKLEFVKPDLDYCNNAKTIYGKSNRDVYLCLESFNEKEYDTVICVDSDMLCINSFDYHLVHKKNADLGAVYTVQAGHEGPNNTKGWEKTKNEPDIAPYVEKINGGFWIIGKKWLTGKIYNEMKKVVKDETHNISGADQETVNRMLRRYQTVYSDNLTYLSFPFGYNFKNWGGVKINIKEKIGRGGENLFQKCKEHIKIIHFSGRRKPWANHLAGPPKDVCSLTSTLDMEMSTPVQMWHQYYKECFGERCHDSIIIKEWSQRF